MSNERTELRLDKTAFEVGELHNEGDDRHFWWSKSPDERLMALELMRQSAFGYDPLTDRLQRVFAVASLGEC
jgi:hypothetical protein